MCTGIHITQSRSEPGAEVYTEFTVTGSSGAQSVSWQRMEEIALRIQVISDNPRECLAQWLPTGGPRATGGP